MSWWFHLLVRRVEDIGKRADVLERVARAVGRVVFSAQVEPLLTYVACGTTRCVSGGEFSRRALSCDDIHSAGDLPAFVHDSGFMSWWLRGKRHRPVGKLAVVRIDSLRCIPLLEQGYYLHGVKVDEHGVPIGRSALRE
jgi:hypothetical protein